MEAVDQQVEAELVETVKPPAIRIGYRSLTGKVFYVNPDRCIGCKSCVLVCSLSHAGTPMLTVQMIGEYSIPMHCQHCEVSACMEACPEEAISRNELGLVIINESKCVGCGACAIACPFGAVRVDEARRVAVKCDLCFDKLEKGELPMCVRTCPAQAVQIIECIGCNFCVASCPFARKYPLGQGK